MATECSDSEETELAERVTQVVILSNSKMRAHVS